MSLITGAGLPLKRIQRALAHTNKKLVLTGLFYFLGLGRVKVCEKDKKIMRLTISMCFDYQYSLLNI